MPDQLVASWIVWALLSAVFAVLTAIFAKIGVENINSDLATFIRTMQDHMPELLVASCEPDAEALVLQGPALPIRIRSE